MDPRRLIFIQIYLIFLTHLMALSLTAQSKTPVYCFPGQGSDRHIFDSLVLDSGYEVKVIEYGAPEKGLSMEAFARKLSDRINTTHDFILLGVSLGGMICVELTEILNPKKTIIISSAKNRNELPFRYKFQRVVPLYELFGGRSLLAGAKMLQPVVEPDRNKNKETFKGMLSAKDPVYMKRTIALIVTWKRTSNTKKVYHIHGTRDHTIPLRNLSHPDYVIPHGSHMMTLTRPRVISTLVQQIVSE